jgi:hypothetical protein
MELPHCCSLLPLGFFSLRLLCLLQLSFIEGHGTGTAVGDKVELTAVATAFAQSVGAEGAAAAARSAVGMTSIKSLLGHCKAAAGVAGLLKVCGPPSQRSRPWISWKSVEIC